MSKTGIDWRMIGNFLSCTDHREDVENPVSYYNNQKAYTTAGDTAMEHCKALGVWFGRDFNGPLRVLSGLPHDHPCLPKLFHTVMVDLKHMFKLFMHDKHMNGVDREAVAKLIEKANLAASERKYIEAICIVRMVDTMLGALRTDRIFNDDLITRMCALNDDVVKENTNE